MLSGILKDLLGSLSKKPCVLLLDLLELISGQLMSLKLFLTATWPLKQLGML